MPFTNNYCRNPAAQLGLDGFSVTKNATIQLDSSTIKYGNHSFFVKCPGESGGEGCITAGGYIPGHSVCSASLHIRGTGLVTVSAAVNPGGVVKASALVTLDEQWQRVQLTGIDCDPGDHLYMIVVNNTIGESAQFWISGIQIEDSSPCHPYCDGDQEGCEWLEGFWGGHSICHFENPIAIASNSLGTPNLVNVLQTGQKFFVSADSGPNRTFDDLVFANGPGPVGAVKDFAVSQLTDPDPAQTYTSWNTAGTISTTGGTYTRNWGTFYPPQDYLVSNGQFLYKRAAYMATGFQFSSVPNNGTVNLARIQTEVLPITTGYSAPAPTAFDPPRAVHALIKPDRLNYCTNPSIETNTSGWSATGSGVLSKDTTTSVGQIIEFDDNILTAGTASLKVAVNANGDGAQISIPNLIPGYTYIASAYVQAGAGLENILLSAGAGATSVLASGGTGYDFGNYGDGPYGGVSQILDLPLTTWFRINCIFTATLDTHVLQVSSASAADVAYPTSMWIDAVMVEPGELLQFYFDGSFGHNFSWEGTVNLSRSYYYDQEQLKKNAVLNVLEGHVPLGIDFSNPVYNTTPIA